MFYLFFHSHFNVIQNLHYSITFTLQLYMDGIMSLALCTFGIGIDFITLVIVGIAL